MANSNVESWNLSRVFWDMSPAKCAKFFVGARMVVMGACIAWYIVVWTILRLIEVVHKAPPELYIRLLLIQMLSFVMEWILFTSICRKNRKALDIWRCSYLLRNLRGIYSESTMPVNHPLAAIFMHWILRSFSKEIEEEEKAGNLKSEPMLYRIGVLCVVGYLEMYVHLYPPMAI